MGNAAWWLAPAIATALVAGCASSSPTTATPAPGSAGGLPFELKPGGPTSTLGVRAEVLPMGVVPYDNMTLPIVSPDGRYLATESGVDPTWETILAEPAASVPQATSVEIYELVRGSRSPRQVAVIAEPVLLGRSCDGEGFLVEAPRPDGARWIGWAGWSNGGVSWLIRDDAVNAFASRGPNGQLAWSRRAAEGEHFELVVRGGDGGEWAVGGAGEDWVMPIWTPEGDALFVLHVRDGRLQVLYGNARSAAAFRQSLRTLTLAQGASVYTAFQVMNGQVNASGLRGGRPDELIFRHPVSRRVAIWQPLAAGGGVVRVLHPDSSFAVVDDAGFALVTTGENLVRQNIGNTRFQIDLLAGTLIPRETRSLEWPYVLLAPTEKTIGVTAMRLLSPEPDE